MKKSFVGYVESLDICDWWGKLLEQKMPEEKEFLEMPCIKKLQDKDHAIKVKITIEEVEK